MHVKYYKVAGITVEVKSDFPIGESTFHLKFRQFEVDAIGDDTVHIEHHFYIPESIETLIAEGNNIYSKNQWKILKIDNQWIYDFRSMVQTDPGHSAMGVFSEDYSNLSVFTTDITRRKYRNAKFHSLALFNSDQIMFAQLLCNRKGAIIHSNGFDINGRGILLMGASGSGKSTLSRMLKARGAKILCDDRIFVKSIENEYWIHGNWCHGSVPDTSSGSAELNQIFFLEKSTTNSIEEIQDKKEILHKLLQALIHPILVENGWEKTFSLIEGMVKRVKCYRAKFDLTGDICNAIFNP